MSDDARRQNPYFGSTGPEIIAKLATVPERERVELPCATAALDERSSSVAPRAWALQPEANTQTGWSRLSHSRSNPRT
jgi:hypothetical protein